MNLEAHISEFNTTNQLIREKIASGVGGQASPAGFSKLVANALEQSCDLESFLFRIGDRVRKFHDFFGWKSLKSPKLEDDPLGVCRGALYRSTRYMDIKMSDRSGAKKDKATDYGVHIEHTIPNQEVRLALWSFKNEFKNGNNDYCPDKILSFLLKISVCTALTRSEEHGLGGTRKVIRRGFSQKHPLLTNGELRGVTSLSDLLPFERYDFSNGLEIYEVVNGNIINPNKWTLSDHFKLVEDLYNKTKSYTQ